MDDQTKEALLQQFKAYLDELPPPPPEKEQRLDLTSFYSELTALKNEVKIESRLIKKGLEESITAYSSLNGRSEDENKKREEALLHPLLLGLLDIRDRLTAARQTESGRRSSFFSRFCKRERKIISALHQGREMTLERLDTLLAAHQIQAIEALGQPFDPTVMRAAVRSCEPQQEDGTVTGEIRKGFLWRGEVLRPADVEVNRH